MLVKACFVALVAALGISAAPLEKKQYGVQVIRDCYVPGTVALTYDDGMFNYENDIANRFNGGKATFFINGNNWGCIYDRVDQLRALHSAGHTLGSHTWSHPDLTTLDWNGINYELERVEQAFIRILGLKPLYFRPPYGKINDLVLQVLGSRGYKKVFLWSDDTQDANGGSIDDGKRVIDNVANSYPDGRNVLMHSVQSSTAYDLTPYAVDRLSGAGYRLVSVDTCLGDDGEWPYEWIGQPGNRDGSWTC